MQKIFGQVKQAQHNQLKKIHAGVGWLQTDIHTMCRPHTKRQGHCNTGPNMLKFAKINFYGISIPPHPHQINFVLDSPTTYDRSALGIIAVVASTDKIFYGHLKTICCSIVATI